MNEVTYYVALPFVAADDAVAPGEAVECFSANPAVMHAKALSRKLGCAGRTRADARPDSEPLAMRPVRQVDAAHPQS
jgi:hypothetical protein